MNNLDLSIVIPCYNSGQWINELVKRIDKQLTDSGLIWELILVNDHSPDQNETWQEIVKSSQKNKFVSGINLQRNAGQFNATLCGLEYSKGDIVVLMDDDLQHRPEDILKLISPLEREEVDCVMARFENKSHSFIKNLGSHVVRASYYLFHGLKKGTVVSSYRAMKRPVVEMMLRHKTSLPVIGSILIKSCRNITNVDVDHEKRLYGNSGYSLSRMIKVTLDNIFLATTLPLRLFTYFGFLVFFASISGSVYYIYKYVSVGSSIPGFTTLAILQLFLISITSIGLGLLGEYIDRIISEVNDSPRWHVRETVGEISEKSV